MQKQKKDEFQNQTQSMFPLNMESIRFRNQIVVGRFTFSIFSRLYTPFLLRNMRKFGNQENGLSPDEVERKVKQEYHRLLKPFRTCSKDTLTFYVYYYQDQLMIRVLNMFLPEEVLFSGFDEVITLEQESLDWEPTPNIPISSFPPISTTSVFRNDLVEWLDELQQGKMLLVFPKHAYRKVYLLHILALLDVSTDTRLEVLSNLLSESYKEEPYWTLKCLNNDLIFVSGCSKLENLQQLTILLPRIELLDTLTLNRLQELQRVTRVHLEGWDIH